MKMRHRLHILNAAVAELADAHDSKSCGKPCRFESGQRHFLMPKRTKMPAGKTAQFESGQRYFLMPKRTKIPAGKTAQFESGQRHFLMPKRTKMPAGKIVGLSPAEAQTV